jgi:hypothetical protein
LSAVVADEPVAATVRLKVPGPPLGINAVGVDDAITVTWSLPASDGNTAITDYTVTALPGAETCTTTAATRCTVPGLAPGARYSVRVRATNAVGTGRPSAKAFATPTQTAAQSGADAYTFLDQMMDRYATGSTLRLVQSYSGQGTDAYTYDNALIIDALLARGTPDDRARAEVIGDALLYVQANDPARDGRIRADYDSNRLTDPGAINIYDPTTDVGSMAWTGQALVQLYAATGDVSYRNGAIEIGNWIQDNADDSRGAGGYTGGINADGSTILWKSTEHNIDVYALFTLLAAETGNSAWSTASVRAEGFVESMWIPSQGRFYAGTDDSGITPYNGEQPEDVNSWSYLAMENPAYAASIHWDVHNLAVTGKFSGVSFCLGDTSGVWYEGTAHLAEALEVRGDPGDQAQANTYLADIGYAQLHGKHGNGLGIISASKAISDCDGDHYYASLHTGATAWYLMALRDANPFHLLA